MILYLDTSALIKLYVEEIGSNEVKKLVKAAQLCLLLVLPMWRQGLGLPGSYERES